WSRIVRGGAERRRSAEHPDPASVPTGNSPIRTTVRNACNMLAMTESFEGNRVVRDTGCRYPILNAPVGYFARASLTGAISAAGGFGLMETSSQGLGETEAEVHLVRQRTDAPLRLQMFLRVLKQQQRLDEVLDWILDGRTPLVATCVGDPAPISK